MWFVFALITLLSWGTADLFYKKAANEEDKYSHLKTSMMVGLVMGIHAICMLIFTDMNYSFMNILIYLPVSLMYILSMTVGYFRIKVFRIINIITNTKFIWCYYMFIVFDIFKSSFRYN